MNNPTIRIRAGALLMRDQEVLLIKYDDPRVGLHYNFPGGGVEPGEALHEALRRELWEEACVEIDIQRLLYVYEYVPQMNEKTGFRHSLSFLFLAALQPGFEPRLPDKPDSYQIAVHWVSLQELHRVPLVPPGMQPRIIAALNMPDGFNPFLDHQWG